MKNDLPTHDLLVKIMKALITQAVLMICVIGLSYARKINAQDKLNQRISIKLESQSIKEMLAKLEQTTKIKFSYSADVIQANRTATLVVQNKTLKEALDLFLKPLQITYRLASNQLLLTPNVESSNTLREEKAQFIQPTIPQEVPITGIVKDGKGETLPGVSVIIKGTQKGTVTNVNGEYSIFVPDKNAVLVFSYVGFISQEIIVGSSNTINPTLHFLVQSD